MSNQDSPQFDAMPFARREALAIQRTDFLPYGNQIPVGGLVTPFYASEITTPLQVQDPNFENTNTVVGGGSY